MSTGTYLGKNYREDKYSPGIDAALKYLDKKREERDNRRELALIPWVVGMIAVWGIFYFMYFGY